MYLILACHIFINIILINTVWFHTVLYFGEQYKVQTLQECSTYEIQVYVGSFRQKYVFNMNTGSAVSNAVCYH
jgi:hypothetical protein